jgi:hypothetical protein
MSNRTGGSVPASCTGTKAAYSRYLAMPGVRAHQSCLMARQRPLRPASRTTIFLTPSGAARSLRGYLLPLMGDGGAGDGDASYPPKIATTPRAFWSLWGRLSFKPRIVGKCCQNQ